MGDRGRFFFLSSLTVTIVVERARSKYAVFFRSVSAEQNAAVQAWRNDVTGRVA